MYIAAIRKRFDVRADEKLTGFLELDSARKHDCQLEHGSRCRSIGPDRTMDGKKLAAGNYVMSVVSEGKTGSILLTIK
jgi:hypothetical protein